MEPAPVLGSLFPDVRFGDVDVLRGLGPALGRNSVADRTKTSTWPRGLVSELQWNGLLVRCRDVSIAISSLLESKLSWAAFLLLLEVSRSCIEMDSVPYSQVIACIQGTQWSMALQLLGHMLERTILPDIVLFNTAISAFNHGGQWRHALNFLLTATDFGLKLDTVSYNNALKACQLGGKWNLINALLADMHIRVVNPNGRTYNHAITVCAACEKWKTALELVQKMRHNNLPPTVVTYGAAISACAGSGQWQHALHLYRQATWDKLMLTVPLYGATMAACASGHRWIEALSLLTSMARKIIKPDLTTMNTAITAFGRGEQWRWALEMLQMMQNRRQAADTITFNTLISACEASHQWELAVELLREMHCKRLYPDAISHSALILACGTAQQWQQALAVFGEVLNEHHNIGQNVFNAATRACALSQCWEEALWLLEERWRHRVPRDAHSYNDVINACGGSGYLDQAMRLAKQMLSYKLQPDIVTSTALVGACRISGQWQLGCLYVEESDINGIVLDTTFSSAVTSLYQQALQWQAALGMLQSKSRGLDEENVIVCNAALDACEVSGGAASVFPLLRSIESRGTKLLSEDLAGKENVGHAVVALEMLAHHGRLRGTPTAQFHRRILVPVATRLRQVQGLDAPLASHAESRAESSQQYFWQLRDGVLERQFGLGRVFAAEALQNLEFARTRSDALVAAWRMKGHLAARRAMFATQASKKSGPEFKRRVAWLCFTAAPQAVGFPAESSTACGSLGFTAGWDNGGFPSEDGGGFPSEELQQQGLGNLPQVLPAVLVGTKPSQHAERQALLLALHGCVTFAEMQTPAQVAGKPEVAVKQGTKRKVTLRLYWPQGYAQAIMKEVIMKDVISKYTSAILLSMKRQKSTRYWHIRLKGSNAAIAKARVLLLSLILENTLLDAEDPRSSRLRELDREDVGNRQLADGR